MSMIREWSSFKDSNIVLEYVENGRGSKDCHLRGIAIQAEKRNHNERVYPQHEIEQAVMQMNQKLEKGESILCECDHPETLSINLERVAGMITKVWMEGNNGMADIKLLPTAMGENIRRMLESGVKLGVSSRGSGDVDFNGVVSNFEIVTIDIVAQPSAPEAYPTVVFESLYRKSGHSMQESVASPALKSSNIGTENEIANFFRNLRAQ